MTTTPTPGPWDYDRAPQDYDGGGSPAYCTVTADNGDIIIAEVNDKIAEGVANARLTAAAPCLLSALMDLRCEGGFRDLGHLEEVEALIAKATGGGAP